MKPRREKHARDLGPKGVGRAVCLVSGGLDSCVAAAVAAAREHRLSFLHIRYRQLTERQELHAFERIADYYGVKERVVADVEYLARIGGSALTDRSIPIPNGDPDRIEVPETYVPFRNANLLAIATSWAEVLNADFIFIGVTDQGGSPYPDCRAGFLEAFQKVIEQGTARSAALRLEAPLLHLSKADIVRKGIELGAPLESTWSCYRPLDHSCLLRSKGFPQAGVADPALSTMPQSF